MFVNKTNWFFDVLIIQFVLLHVFFVHIAVCEDFIQKEDKIST